MALEGPGIYYYPNGTKRSLVTFKNGSPNGYTKTYYPNGQFYSLSLNNALSPGGRGNKLIECRDSTGKVLAQNGNGKWIKFDNDLKHKVEEGMIKDSLEEGEWQTFIGDTPSPEYKVIYKHGIVISSTQPGWIDQIFSSVDVAPQFKNGGNAGFIAYLAKSVKFLTVDRIKGIQGRVIMTFVVGKDGTLSDIKVLRSPSESMSEASIKAVGKSPAWLPGTQNGVPVRVQYTISLHLA